jgi:hypothetical protein
MQNKYTCLISICFVIVTMTIISLFIQNSIATANSIQNSNSTNASYPDKPQSISPGDTN